MFFGHGLIRTVVCIRKNGLHLYVFSAALAPPSLCVQMKPVFSYTHNRAYQTVSEKQTGLSAGPILRPRDIRAYKIGFSRPILHRRSDAGHTPRKLPHNYNEQSPASSHNTPVLLHTRLINIPAYSPYVNLKFRYFCRNFRVIFVEILGGWVSRFF